MFYYVDILNCAAGIGALIADTLLIWIQKMDPPIFWDALGAIGTISAVIVALFQESIRSWQNKTKLELIIRDKAPDSGVISMVYPDGVNRPVYYIRASVKNKKNKIAKNVQIMLTRCLDFETKIDMTNIFPINLVWSHFIGAHSVDLPGGVSRLLDLGYFEDSLGGKEFKITGISKPNKKDEIVESNVLWAGKYLIELTITSDNTDPVKQWHDLEFDADTSVFNGKVVDWGSKKIDKQDH